jgi:acetoin utilization protein AcuB
MFYVQSINGRIFSGPLEQLNRANGLASTRRIPPITRDADEIGAEFVMPHQENEAVNAYRQMISPDLERGPLYHAEQVMSRSVIIVDAQSAVADVWKILRDNRIHQAPVVDESQTLIGIVSERDLLTAIDTEGDEIIATRQRQVKDVMSTPVVAAAPITDIRRIAAVMLDNGVDGVPVVSETGRIIGFVSHSDILRAVVTDPPLSLWR